MRSERTQQGGAVAPVLNTGGVLQRKCGCGQHTIAGGSCSECQKKKGVAQRKASHGGAVNEAPPIVHDVLRSPGQPLDDQTRAYMEPRFQHNFSGVRVHTDAKAGASAQAVNARAYTVGQHVVFGSGEFAPTTLSGKHVFAHELAHVVQQASSPGHSPQKLTIGEASGGAEQEADRAAQAVLSDGPVAVSQGAGAKLQRLGANAGCTAAQRDMIHQGIFDARGWLNKAIPALAASPLSARTVGSLARNFGPTYGVAANATLIHDRLVAVRSALGTIPFSCASAPGDAVCVAGNCGWANAGSRAATICSDVTLPAGADWLFAAGCVLHETFHATFSGMTAAHDSYSGWHGHSSTTAGFPGAGVSPLLNADSYTTLVMDLS